MAEVGRPRRALGTRGPVTVTPQVRDGKRWATAPEGVTPERWRARTRVRDLDGKTRHIERVYPVRKRETVASVRRRAEAAFDVEIRERITPRSSNDLRPNMTVSEAGAAWLRQVARPESGLSENTVEQYRGNFGRYIERGDVAGLTLREVNAAPIVRRFLEGVADAHGAGAAKTARSVLSNIVRMAVDDGVLDSNAVRDVRPPKPSQPIVRPVSERRPVAAYSPEELARDTRRALTADERAQLIEFAKADAKAQHYDVADLLLFMAGTGVRLGEALAQSWDDVDLDAGTVHVRGTKTEYSDRVLHLPSWLIERLSERAERGIDASGIVFSSPKTGGRRDRRNAQRHLRHLLDRAGFPWATPHTLRRTVASLIDQQGGGVALAAEQLGHSDPSMTMSVYLGRKSDTSRAAAML